MVWAVFFRKKSKHPQNSIGKKFNKEVNAPWLIFFFAHRNIIPPSNAATGAWVTWVDHPCIDDFPSCFWDKSTEKATALTIWRPCNDVRFLSGPRKMVFLCFLYDHPRFLRIKNGSPTFPDSVSTGSTKKAPVDIHLDFYIELLQAIFEENWLFKTVWQFWRADFLLKSLQFWIWTG